MSGSAANLLFDLHQQAGAEFQNWEDVQIVQTFGEPQAEYAAIRKTCGLMDLPQRGILELTGKDRLRFLNNLLTNQTFDKDAKTDLAPGKGVYAFLLDPKTGRIIADMNVIERGNATILEMDIRMIGPVAQAIEGYRFSEQVTIANQSEVLHEIALHGPGAEEILQNGMSLPDIDALKDHDSIAFENVIVWRDDSCGVPGHHVIQPATAARKMWTDLLARFGERVEGNWRPMRPIGWAAFNSARIEAGRALFGIDYDQSVVPAETGQLARAVSFTKGCYPGQEIVARMHARGQLAKQIVGIRMESDALPIAAAQIFDAEGNQIGVITSSTISPMLSGAAICLGMVKKPHYAVGTKLQIPAEGAMRSGSVVELPFIGERK